MYRQCSEGVDHQALGACSSPYHFAAEPEALSCQDLVRLRRHQDTVAETSDFRGDVPPKKTRATFPPGHDDGAHLLDEPTVGSQGYFTGSTADYSSQSYRSKIATFSSSIAGPYAKPAGLQRASFNGEDYEADKKPLSVNKGHLESSLLNVGYSAQTPLNNNHILATGTAQRMSYDHVQANRNDKTVKPNEKNERKAVEYYKKATYAVLIGNTVRVFNTKLYASLPLCNKCMVKERVKDSSGATRVKLKLKTFDSRLVFSFIKHQLRSICLLNITFLPNT